MARPKSRIRDVYVRIDGVMRKIPGLNAVLSNDENVANRIVYFDTSQRVSEKLATGEIIQVLPNLNLEALRDE